MFTKLAVIRINHPDEGKYTVMSIHDSPDEAQAAWNKHSKEVDVVIELVDAKAKRDDVGDMAKASRMRNYGTDEEEYEI